MKLNPFVHYPSDLNPFRQDHKPLLLPMTLALTLRISLEVNVTWAVSSPKWLFCIWSFILDVHV